MESFEDVYNEYWDMVFRFLFRLCKNRDLAAELCQETFYQAMKGWKRYRGESKASTWLCAIAKRVYNNSMRGEKELPLFEEAEHDESDVSELLVKKDQQMTALKMLHEMPEPYQEVFMLRTFCDLSHRQIGELFGRTEGWARVIYHRARQMLRQAMKEEL